MNVKPTDSTTDDGLHADGGSPAEVDIFTYRSDQTKLTRWEKTQRWFDAYLYAPLSVAWDDIRARVGIILIIGFILTGTVGVRVIPKPYAMEGPPLVQPLEQPLQYPLGTDALGRDLFAMIVHSTPAMIKMIGAGALLSVGIGTVFGVIAGYEGGVVDSALMTISDTVLTIPALPLIMLLAAIWQPKSPIVVGILLGIDNWPGLSRTLRSQVLSIREEAFIEASRSMALSKSTIFRKDIIANLMPFISVNFATSARRIIFESVALYYLGILPFSALNWGVILNQAYHNGRLGNPEQFHWLYVPMITIILVSMGFILFAQGLDRVFNVRLRAKHARTKNTDGKANRPT